MIGRAVFSPDFLAARMSASLLRVQASLASAAKTTSVLRLLLYKTLASAGATDDVGVGSREAWARIQYKIYAFEYLGQTVVSVIVV